MRQAGRYQKSYRAIRAHVTFLELCKNPDLAAQVTVAPVKELGVDAAILFADLLLIAEPLGFHLEFAKTGGPIIHNPFRAKSDLARVRKPNVSSDLGYVTETIRRARKALPADIPLIGFAGAPFTLAAYLVEGGGSKNYIRTRRLMMSEPSLWDRFAARLTDATLDYLSAQVEAGCQAVQLFDSWVGCLDPKEFETRTLPHLTSLVKKLKARHPETPVLYFGTQTSPYFGSLKDLGADVLGVDWRVKLDEAWRALGPVALQGNLDPAALFAPLRELKKRAEDVLHRAAGRPGHIFNLGHGIAPDTPYENVKALVEIAHQWNPR